LITCFGPRTAWGRVDGKHLADNEPIEQMADRGKVLLRCRLRGRLQQCLDISGDVDRLDLDQPDLILFEPGEERAGRSVIGHARILVADRDRKKFEKAARGKLAGVGDHRRHRELTDDRAKAAAGPFHDKLVHGG
jgi:hypothetical protein